MSVLLIAEHNNKEVRPFTLNAITAASQIDADVHVLLIGNNCGDVAKLLSEMPAVKKVLQACNTFLTAGISDNNLATSPQLLPINKTCTSASIWDAAVIAFNVNGLTSLLLCSAINKTDIILLLPHF